MSSFIVTEGFGSSGPAYLTILSMTVNPTSIVILLSAPAILAGDASVASNWVITPTDNPIDMYVTSISGSGTDTVTLNTTRAKIGGTYTLSIPLGVIQVSDSSPLTPPYIKTFTGNGVTTSISVIVGNDARHFDVLYSDIVLEAGAMNIANYSVSPLLTPLSIVRVNSGRYRVTTLEAQTPDVVYTLTVSNVFDLYGNESSG